MTITKMISALLITAACVMLTGCFASPKILVSQDFVGERSVQYVMQKTITTGGKKDKKQLFNFSVRICSVGSDGKQTDCQDTTVLENVQAKPVY